MFRQKKVWLLIFISFLTLSFGFKNVYAADTFDFQKAYQDYTFNYDLYSKAFATYDLSRSQYLASKTLSAKSKAIDDTRKMLQARDEVVTTYLTMLRMKVKENSGIENNEKEAKFVSIDNEVKWYKDHKVRLSSAATLEDLVDDSNEAKTRYDSTELLVYQVLLSVNVGKIDGERKNIEGIVNRLTTKINEIGGRGDKNISAPQRWLIEISSRITRSNEKVSEAKNRILAIKVTNRNKLGDYNEAKFRLQEALQYLKEANSYVEQIIKNIKTAD